MSFLVWCSTCMQESRSGARQKGGCPWGRAHRQNQWWPFFSLAHYLLTRLSWQVRPGVLCLLRQARVFCFLFNAPVFPQQWLYWLADCRFGCLKLSSLHGQRTLTVQKYVSSLHCTLQSDRRDDRTVACTVNYHVMANTHHLALRLDSMVHGAGCVCSPCTAPQEAMCYSKQIAAACRYEQRSKQATTLKSCSTLCSALPCFARFPRSSQITIGLCM